jgi:hypothetical protein
MSHKLILNEDRLMGKLIRLNKKVGQAEPEQNNEAEFAKIKSKADAYLREAEELESKVEAYEEQHKDARGVFDNVLFYVGAVRQYHGYVIKDVRSYNIDDAKQDLTKTKTGLNNALKIYKNTMNEQEAKNAPPAEQIDARGNTLEDLRITELKKLRSDASALRQKANVHQSCPNIEEVYTRLLHCTDAISAAEDAFRDYAGRNESFIASRIKAAKELFYIANKTLSDHACAAKTNVVPIKPMTVGDVMRGEPTKEQTPEEKIESIKSTRVDPYDSRVYEAYDAVARDMLNKKGVADKVHNLIAEIQNAYAYSEAALHELKRDQLEDVINAYNDAKYDARLLESIATRLLIPLNIHHSSERNAPRYSDADSIKDIEWKLKALLSDKAYAQSFAKHPVVHGLLKQINDAIQMLHATEANIDKLRGKVAKKYTAAAAGRIDKANETA